MSAAGRPACLAGNYIMTGGRMQPYARRAMDMRKVGPLLLLMITALLLANGVALAATTRCSNSSDPLSNFCVGTDQNDTMIGTDWDDPTYGDDRMIS